MRRYSAPSLPRAAMVPLAKTALNNARQKITCHATALTDLVNIPAVLNKTAEPSIKARPAFNIDFLLFVMAGM